MGVGVQEALYVYVLEAVCVGVGDDVEDPVPELEGALRQGVTGRE